MAKNWDDVKGIIIDYYQTRTLKDVMIIMRDHHGFKASQRSYRQKFKDWGVRKYRSHDTTWSSPSGGSTATGPRLLQPFEHPTQQPRTFVPPSFNNWQRTSSHVNPAVSLHTPESDSGRDMSGFERMMPNVQGRHGRTGSNATQVSTSSQKQHQLSPWGAAPIGLDAHYTAVSMSSPLSMPATASPHQPPFSPSAPHHDNFQLYHNNPYNPPHHQSNTHASPQQHPPSFATPWNQLQAGSHQSRAEFFQMRTQSQVPTDPEDGLHNNVSDVTNRRWPSEKAYDPKGRKRG